MLWTRGEVYCLVAEWADCRVVLSVLQHLMEEQAEVHQDQAADFQVALANSRGELPDAATLTELGDELQKQMYRDLAELQRTLTRLQLGDADFGENSFGYSLWSILAQLEENICDKRSSEYQISFEARFQPEKEQGETLSAGERRRALLATGGGSGGGGSSAGKVSATTLALSYCPPLSPPLVASAANAAAPCPVCAPPLRDLQSASGQGRFIVSTANWGGYVLTLGNRTGVNLQVSAQRGTQCRTRSEGPLPHLITRTAVASRGAPRCSLGCAVGRR